GCSDWFGGRWSKLAEVVPGCPRLAEVGADSFARDPAPPNRTNQSAPARGAPAAAPAAVPPGRGPGGKGGGAGSPGERWGGQPQQLPRRLQTYASPGGTQNPVPASS